MDTDIPSRKETKHPIAGWTRQRRKILGLSQSDVAARMSKLAGTHVDANYLALIERGRTEAPRKHLRAFALALETTEEEVLRSAGIIPAEESTRGDYPGTNPFAPETLLYEIVELLGKADQITKERVLNHLKLLLDHPPHEERNEERGKDVFHISEAASGPHKRSKAAG